MGNIPDGTYIVRDNELVPHEIGFGYYVAIAPINPKEAARENSLIGVWTNPKTNKLCIDKTIWIHNESEAIETGRHYSQIAIWDIANKREIYL